MRRFQLNYKTLWINFEPELQKKQQNLYSLDTLRWASFNIQVQRKAITKLCMWAYNIFDIVGLLKFIY